MQDLIKTMVVITEPSFNFLLILKDYFIHIM
jgi:hypothetical protein